MKFCELCKGLARMYCESDSASLCWNCDAKVHSANFLAARHSRSLLCQVCQSPTAWSAAGAKVGKTVSVCDRCVDGYYNTDEVEESESLNDEGSYTEDEENDYEDEDEVEVDSEDIQVVPWSTTPPPPPASSTSSEDSSNVPRNGSLKRMRDTDADLHSDDDSGSWSCHRKTNASPVVEAAAVVDSRSRKTRTPAKMQKTDRLAAPGCTEVMEFIRRNNRQTMSSSAVITELCKLNDDSRAVDLESSETS